MPAKNDITIIIGKRIRKRRKELKLTQEQAAEQCGLSSQFFACIERGIKSVRAENILKIAEGLHVSTDYILLGKMREEERQALFVDMQHLDTIQSGCLEKIVLSFVAACKTAEETYK